MLSRLFSGIKTLTACFFGKLEFLIRRYFTTDACFFITSISSFNYSNMNQDLNLIHIPGKFNIIQQKGNRLFKIYKKWKMLTLSIFHCHHWGVIQSQRSTCNIEFAWWCHQVKSGYFCLFMKFVIKSFMALSLPTIHY